MRTKYICDICGSSDEDKSLVERCEAQGHPDPKLFPPLWLLVGDNCGPGMKPSGVRGSPRCAGPKWNDGKPCNSHHCGAGFIWVVQWAGVSRHDSHEYGVAFGNFRGNGCGDTFDFSGTAESGYDPFKMGQSKYYPEQGFRRWQDWPEAQECPAFWRAVKALRAAGREARVLRNGQAVLFDAPLPKEAA